MQYNDEVESFLRRLDDTKHDKTLKDAEQMIGRLNVSMTESMIGGAHSREESKKHRRDLIRQLLDG